MRIERCLDTSVWKVDVATSVDDPCSRTSRYTDEDRVNRGVEVYLASLDAGFVLDFEERLCRSSGLGFAFRGIGGGRVGMGCGV